MNSLNLSRCALGFAVTAILLAGCGGGLPSSIDAPVAQNAATTRYVPRPILLVHSDSKISGETFTSTSVRSRCHGKQTMRGSFHAHGSASGPVPGTFTASGNAGQSNQGHSHMRTWGFEETFTITSGSQEVSGSVSSGGGEIGNPFRCSNHMLAFKLGGRFFSLGYKLKGQRGSGAASATLEGGPSGQTFTESFQ